MAADDGPLSSPGKTPPALTELVSRVHRLAANSENMELPSPHLRLRMAQRGVVMRQILETLLHGEGISGPTLDVYGDWRIKLRRMVAGRRVQVVVAVKQRSFSVVTVI